MNCPCDLGSESGRAYEACCAPFHAGQEPPDAPTLMRSRYSAFARGQWAYLARTLHQDHPDASLSPRVFRERLDKHAKRTRYRGLRILDRAPADDDGVARVLFHVSMMIAGKDASFVELSSFVHEGAGWRYLTGVTRAPRAVGDLSALDIARFGA